MMNENSGAALRRREVIRRLIAGRSVRSQAELGRLLASEGLEAAQPTLSRDIHELGLVKGSGGYRLPDAAPKEPAGEAEASVAGRRLERVARLVRQYVLSVEPAGMLVVLRTPPADAQPVALAIDAASLDGVAGTIAGDDTIFLAARSVTEARDLARRLRALLRSGAEARPARFPSRRRRASARRRA
jgi:transcriptional regulator of arginine metabolism